MQWSKWQLPQLAWYAGYGEQQCVILSAKLAYNILDYFFFRQQLVFSLSPFDLGFDFFVPYQYFFAKILCWCKLKTILISFSCWIISTKIQKRLTRVLSSSNPRFYSNIYKKRWWKLLCFWVLITAAGFLLSCPIFRCYLAQYFYSNFMFSAAHFAKKERNVLEKITTFSNWIKT